MTTWNKCHNVTILDRNELLLCKGCCVPSTKEFQVAADVVIEPHSLVKAGETAKQVLPWAVGDTVLGIALCGVDSTDECDEDLCVLLRNALVKEAGINWPAGITEAQKATALAELEAKNILTAVSVGNCL
jgi:hypothetical protein